MTAPPVWMLPNSHPDLCPGSHHPTCHRVCIGMVVCPTCHTPHPTYPAPAAPGGGRINAHHRTIDIQLTLNVEVARG